MRNKTLLALTMAGILLGACGGDGDEVGAGSPTSTSAPAPVTAVDAPSTTTTTTTGPALNASSTLDLRGLGPVRVGMTLAEATAAAGIQIGAATVTESAVCSYATVEGGPVDVHFMVTDGQIARVDVGADSPVKTRSGAGIGDTEAQVQALYPGIEVSAHKYVRGGHYLTLVPADPADAAFRLIFETDGSNVTRFRSGRLPEVGYVEGCS